MCVCHQAPEPESEAAIEALPGGGVYALAVKVARPSLLAAGALGQGYLDAGEYVYVGSAQRGLSRRILRHLASSKRRRWHIDYLTALWAPWLVAAWEGERALECRLARILLTRWPPAIRRFGSSDCKCPSHLIGPVGAEWLDMLSRAIGQAPVVVRAYGKR